MVGTSSPSRSHHARRRRWVLVVAVAVLLLAGGGVTAVALQHGSSSAQAAPRPAAVPGSPNIVLIMTDDMWLGELKYMPRTERLLGKQGVTFTDFTAPQPLCCPARAQMLTGQYAQNNGVMANSGPNGGYQAFTPQTALPVWLQAAGYQTAMIGKYLNGYPQNHPKEVGWDHWDPTVRHIYDYFGYTQYDDGAMIRPQAYHTDYVTSRSEALIKQMAPQPGEPADQQRPFFLWSSYIAPHGVCKVKDEVGNCSHPPRPGPFRGKYRGVPGITDTYPSFNEQDMSDKPPFLRHRPKLNVAHLDRLSDRRAEALTDVDRGVAGIVKALRTSGQLDNTLILFTSDNGYLIGQHRYEGKVLGYEEAVKIPLLMRGLGLPAGAVDNRTYAMIDLAPTFAALAHATPQVTVDGAPIVVRDGLGSKPPDRTLLIQAGVTNLARSPDGWWFRGVRTRRYTYVAWTSGFRELYDRRRDPYQLRNLAGHARYAKIQHALDRRTTALGACAGEDCRRPFPDLPDPLRPRDVNHERARASS